MKLSEKGFEKILDTCHFDEDSATYALNYSWPKKDYHFEIQETEFEPDDFEDFEKELSKFFFKLMEEQKPLPADMARLLNEHFWELT